jgi:acetylornithine deacetylase/succinyl-diaminopimelate desuccinylase-like protein
MGVTRHQSIEIRTRETFRSLTAECAQLDALDAEILETQIAVSRIPAPTGHERHRAEWVSARLRGYGLEVRTDAAGNVIARAPHQRPTRSPMVVAAHLDTVFPIESPLEFIREGQRVIGPGVSDNGRGLAAMLALARVLPRDSGGWTRPVEFVATTAEEGAGDLRGIKHYVEQAARPFALLVLDGAGDDHVVHSAPGSRRFRVEYRGPGGHSWAAYGTVNPVHAAARAAAGLASLQLPATGRSTLTVSRIGGGLSVNAIPGDAWFEVDVRSTSEAALVRIEHDLMDVTRAAAGEENRRSANGARLSLNVTRIGVRPAGETSADSDLVMSAMEATRLVGRVPAPAAASTDANAAMAAGIPAIAIGGGGKGGDAHTMHEWYENAGAAAGVQRALTIVATMARIAAD